MHPTPVVLNLVLLYHCVNLIRGLDFSISRQVLHFCMWNFVSPNKANRALLLETKLHVQKYIEANSRIGGNPELENRHKFRS